MVAGLTVVVWKNLRRNEMVGNVCMVDYGRRIVVVIYKGGAAAASLKWRIHWCFSITDGDWRLIMRLRTSRP